MYTFFLIFLMKFSLYFIVENFKENKHNEWLTINSFYTNNFKKDSLWLTNHKNSFFFIKSINSSYLSGSVLRNKVLGYKVCSPNFHENIICFHMVGNVNFCPNKNKLCHCRTFVKPCLMKGIYISLTQTTWVQKYKY